MSEATTEEDKGQRYVVTSDGIKGRFEKVWSVPAGNAGSERVEAGNRPNTDLSRKWLLNRVVRVCTVTSYRQCKFFLRMTSCYSHIEKSQRPHDRRRDVDTDRVRRTPSHLPTQPQPNSPQTCTHVDLYTCQFHYHFSAIYRNSITITTTLLLLLGRIAVLRT